MVSGKEFGTSNHTYTRRKIKSEANGASDAAFSCSIRANDHVQVRTGAEFYKVVGDEVLELNAHNGPSNISSMAIRYRLGSTHSTHPSVSRIKARECKVPSVSSFT